MTHESAALLFRHLDLVALDIARLALEEFSTPSRCQCPLGRPTRTSCSRISSYRMNAKSTSRNARSKNS
ncbi:unnamed protein product, partial [Symbiodinium pilosum]